MIKTIHILLFILVQQIAFGQTKGKFSVGIGINSNIESGLRFQTLPQLNIGRFYTKNIDIGLKIGGKYKKTKYQNDITINNQTYNEFTQKDFQAVIYGRYYISDYRLRPFVLGEIGIESNSGEYFKQVSKTAARGTGSRNTAMLTNIGGGFSYAFTKKKNLFLDASLYKGISNTQTYTSSRPNLGIFELRTRYIFGKEK
ncbi:MAG: outer membrane beta-barrel protein [Leadbetterella sp.]|nr:outer membrane beta-barrel protein [Leadbetterella sp.]